MTTFRKMINEMNAKELLALRRALMRFHFNCGVYNLDDMKRDPKTYSTKKLLKEAIEMIN